jgi:uncharacterized protein (TIGR03067 family)
MVIEGDRLTYLFELDGREFRGARAVALGARRTPKVMGSKKDRADYPGIYRLDGDTLTLCYHEKVRPRNFDELGPGARLEVWKRKKR